MPESSIESYYAYASMAMNINIDISNARQLPAKEQAEKLEKMVAEKSREAFSLQAAGRGSQQVLVVGVILLASETTSIL